MNHDPNLAHKDACESWKHYARRLEAKINGLFDRLESYSACIEFSRQMDKHAAPDYEEAMGECKAMEIGRAMLKDGVIVKIEENLEDIGRDGKRVTYKVFALKPVKKHL